MFARSRSNGSMIARTNPLDVPVVEELVRHRVEQARAVGLNARGRRHHRAVPVLHAVAVRRTAGSRRETCSGPARTPGTRRKSRPPRARRARRPARSDRARRRCRCDGRRRETCGRPTENWRIASGPNSTGLSIRYCRFGAVNSSGARARMQLRRDGPGAAGHARRRFERQRRRRIVEPARPHDRRGHVHVDVRRVDREIRAVDEIAEDLVPDRHRAAVRGHGPSGWIGPGRPPARGRPRPPRARRRRSSRSRGGSSGPATIGSCAARAARRRGPGTSPRPASSGAVVRGR